MTLVGSGVVVSMATATPTPSTTYYACLSNVGGVLNKVNTKAPPKCGVGSKNIKWSQIGPAGTHGTNGTNGTIVVTSPGAPSGACTTGDTDIDLANGEVNSCVTSAWNDSGSSVEGPAGSPGPSTLTALQGSPCTFSGNPSTVNVTQDATTGVITFTCTPVYSVSLTVTGGSMTIIQIDSFTGPEFLHCFNETATCSELFRSGDAGRIVMQSGTDESGGGSSFTLTCPSGWSGSGLADPQPGFTGGTSYVGDCQVSNVTSNATATAAF
jgi:hypothetical protein